ncbi:MAG: ATP-dependent RNA helicase RhlB [Gammaproteobacteria bacterium]|nr:ATP-dependent RNA helicase RhlB [Gammaproteobacteria bacterium]
MSEEKHLSDIKFDQLELRDELLQSIKEAGFTYCTPIQAETLPLALKGKDIAGQAQTGTGKTAAFLLATFNHLLTHEPKKQSKNPRAFILAPTRELAIQIHHDAIQLAKHTDLRFAVAYGGTGYEQQRKQIQDGIDVLIGTPGRLIDYFKQHVYRLQDIQVMVVDEADRMFDLGFITDIRYLFRKMPKPEERLNLLFSATLSFKVTELAYEHMNQPEKIKIETEKVTADKVIQTVYYTANNEKIPLLINLIKSHDSSRSIIFANTKRTVEKIWSFLEGNEIQSAILSGDVPQTKRQSLLKRFQDGELPILVATDVAARGLHIPGVSHVFNFDLPQDPEDYVHRIGRTARAGESGDAISFACEDLAYYLPDIEEFIKHKIERSDVSVDLLAEIKPAKRIQRHNKSRPPHHKKGRQGNKGSYQNRR